MAYLGPSPARTPVTSDQITDASVTAAKLADDAVTTDKVAALTTLATNTIAETTAASGVTIDGLLIKDGAIPSIIVPGKNLLQNGEVSVDQRAGDTRTGLGATSQYLTDRWSYERSGTATARFTFSKGTGITGARGSLRFEVTTADVALAADVIYQFTQKIEAQNLRHLLYGTASAKSVTYQAKIKSNWAGTMTLYIIAPDGSRSYSTPLVVAGDESQETFTFTLPGDASGAINNDTGVGFDWMVTMAAGTDFTGGAAGAWAASNNNLVGASNSGNFFDTISNYFEISLMQLEVGSVATDFEHEDIGTMLAKCKRYYEQMDFDSSSAELVALCNIWDATAGAGLIEYQVEKRALPTVTITAVGTFNVVEGDGTTQAPGSITGIRMGTRSTSISVGLTAAALGGGELRRDATDVCNIKISAEL